MRRIKITFFIILGIIFLTEIILRLTYNKKLAKWHAMEYIPDTLIGYRYKPDALFLNSNLAYSNQCKSNKYGFPGDNFEVKKERGQYRIIIVGTSDDTGFSSNGDQSYAKRLNNIFEQNKYNVEVINCSIDGNDRIVRNMLLIRNELVRYHPNLILLHNQFPLKDKIRYRETYKGNIIYTTKLSEITPTKKYIDQVYSEKNYIFKLYDVSYIFRYYCKIYMDYKKDSPKHWFVKFSENFFTYEKLNKIRMYVRNEVRFTPDDKIFKIYLYGLDTTWNEKTITWNNSPKNYKMIAEFSSGEKSKIWIKTDITKYIEEKVKNNNNEVSLSMFIDPSKMRRIMFASKDWATDSAGVFCPILEITGKKENKNSKAEKTYISTVYLQPTDDGYIRGGTYSDSIQVDSVIQVKNGSNDHSYSRKGLVKFNISGIQSVEKAILKLFVVNIEFGNDMAPDLKDYSERESLDSMKILQSFLKEKDIKLILFNTYKLPDERFKQFFFQNNIDYIPLDIERLPEYSFGDADGHSTQKGHKVIAEKLYNYFINNQFSEEFDTLKCKK